MNTQWLLDAARDFRTANQMLGSPLTQRTFPLRSAVVTLAFSTELYIKYLAATATGSAPKGHSLDKLYSSLPTEIRSRVASHYSYGTPVTDVLIAHKDTFVDWRYVYEKQASGLLLNLESLRHLNDALATTADELTSNR